MSLIERIVFVTFYLTMAVSSTFSANVIRTYHRNKPLGMQTLHGKIIEEVMLPALKYVTWIMCTIMISSEIVGPFPKTLSYVLQVIDYDTVLTFQTALFFVMLVKYLVIYHGPYIDSFNETTIVCFVKVTTVLLPWMLAVFEYNFWTNMEDSVTFQTKHLGYSKPESKLEKGKIACNVWNFVMLLVCQGRIEFDHISHHESEGCLAFIQKAFANNDIHIEPEVGNPENAEEQNNSSLTISTNGKLGYNVSILRIAVACGFIFIVAIIFHATAGSEYSKYNLVIVGFIFTIGGPYLFISNHGGMRKIATEKIRRILSLFKCIAF